MARYFGTLGCILLFTSVCSECAHELYQDVYFQGGDLSSFPAPSVDYCQTTCTFHPQCLFFTYLPGTWPKEAERFSCFMKDSESGLLPNVTLKGAISGHSKKQCNSKLNDCNTETYVGYDMIGINYKSTKVKSTEQCQENCTNDAFCQFFTYVTDKFHSKSLRQTCYLKYTLTGHPTKIRFLDNVESGFSLKPCGVSTAGCKSDIFQEIDFVGDDIASVFAPDLHTCQKICTYYPNCLFFTFVTKDWAVPAQRYQCFLKTSRTGLPIAPKSSENAFSGFSLLSCKKVTAMCPLPILKDADILGSDVEVVYVADHNACQMLCTATIRCQFFTYTSEKGACTPNGCKCNLRMSSNGWPTGILHGTGGISGFSTRLCRVKTNGCGKPVDLSGRVVGGSDSALGEWPWQVSLHIRRIGRLQKHACGGSIISNQWIVSAAHCFDMLNKPDSWRIYAGFLKQSEIKESTPYLKIKDIIIHPSYAKQVAEQGSDIALLRLYTPMNYTDYQLPICLETKLDAIRKYSSCWVTGWGYTQEGGYVAETLQKAEVPQISNEECQAKYKQAVISSSMTCAGYKQGGVDACKGDSGGPLACQSGDTWYLAGVTSWGEGCARQDQPGVYTKVSEFYDWIQQIIHTCKTAACSFFIVKCSID